MEEVLSTWGQDLLWRSGIALDWVKKNICQSQLGIDAGLVLALDNIKSSVRSTIKRNSSRQVSTCVCPQDTVLLPRRLAENCPWPAENARPANNFLIQRGPRTSHCLPGLEIDLLLTLPNFTVTVLAQECDASSFCWYLEWLLLSWCNTSGLRLAVERIQHISWTIWFVEIYLKKNSKFDNGN